MGYGATAAVSTHEQHPATSNTGPTAVTTKWPNEGKCTSDTHSTPHWCHTPILTVLTTLITGTRRTHGWKYTWQIVGDPRILARLSTEYDATQDGQLLKKAYTNYT